MPAVIDYKSIRPPVDAFDIEAVSKADLASAKVVNIIGKYHVDLDTTVTICGNTINVVVCYSNDIGEIDVFRINENLDPVAPEVSHWLSREDYERVFKEAEDASFRKEDADAEVAYLENEDRKCHEYLEERAFGKARDIFSEA